MDDYRTVHVPGNAAEGAWLYVRRAKRKPDWICGCGTRNEAGHACNYCGGIDPDEDAEL